MTRKEELYAEIAQIEAQEFRDKNAKKLADVRQEFIELTRVDKYHLIRVIPGIQVTSINYHYLLAKLVLTDINTIVASGIRIYSQFDGTIKSLEPVEAFDITDKLSYYQILDEIYESALKENFQGIANVTCEWLGISEY